MSEEKREFQTLSDRSLEEEYFFQKDRELIAQHRRQLDAERRQREEAEQRKEYWMRCPKCGEHLQEVKRGFVTLDYCGACKGIFFDKGELEMVLRMERKDTFLDHLAHVLDRVFGAGMDGPKSDNVPPDSVKS